MAEAPFHLEQQHPTSHRYAILEDNGTTLWLYLTEPDNPTVVAQTWIFSHQEAIHTTEWPLFNDRPATVTPVEENAAALAAGLDLGHPEVHHWQFNWSADGEAVAVFCDARPIAMAQSSRKIGFSRTVIRAGPWGVPWSERTFHDLFGMKE